MALAKDLQIWKDTFELVDKLTTYKANFPRIWRYDLGEKMTKIALELFEYIQLANMYADNSYLGLMRHTDSYDIRKRIMLKMDRKFYRHLYIKGRYECVRIRQKYRRDMIARRKLRDKRNFEYLLSNYDDERDGYNKRKGNLPAPRPRKGGGDRGREGSGGGQYRK